MGSRRPQNSGVSQFLVHSATRLFRRGVTPRRAQIGTLQPADDYCSPLSRPLKCPCLPTPFRVPGSVTVAQQILVLFVQVRILAGLVLTRSIPAGPDRANRLHPQVFFVFTLRACRLADPSCAP